MTSNLYIIHLQPLIFYFFLKFTVFTTSKPLRSFKNTNLTPLGGGGLILGSILTQLKVNVNETFFQQGFLGRFLSFNINLGALKHLRNNFLVFEGPSQCLYSAHLGIVPLLVHFLAYLEMHDDQFDNWPVAFWPM